MENDTFYRQTQWRFECVLMFARSCKQQKKKKESPENKITYSEQK